MDKPTARRHLLVIGAIWLLVVVLAAAKGFTVKLHPPTPQIILAILTLGLIAASVFYWPLRSFVLDSDWRALVEIHLVRALAGWGFLWAGSHGRFPQQFSAMAGKGDIAVAVLALLIIIFVSPHRSFAPIIYLIWNIFGLFDVLHVVVDAARIAMANRIDMLELLRMPFAVLPFFVVPILIASHIWLFERIWRRWRGAEVD
jgi:hypothetical protein